MKCKNRYSFIIFISTLFLFCNGCSRYLPELSPGKIPTLQGPSLSGSFHTLAAADLNQDGYIDLVAGSSVPSGHDVIIWYGDRHGTWNKIIKLPVEIN